MSYRSLVLGGLAATLLAGMAHADETITIDDPYFRMARPGAPTGGVFMVIENHGDSDDRLVSASSAIARMVQLHTHQIDANGVAKMTEVEGGFAVPTHGEHALERGGDHVMVMGITAPVEEGTMVPLTLVFEKAGEIHLEVPVDSSR